MLRMIIGRLYQFLSFNLEATLSNLQQLHWQGIKGITIQKQSILWPKELVWNSGFQSILVVVLGGFSKWFL